MSDDVRVIVDALNKPPFSRGLTMISFDAIESLSLLQLLNDVFAVISSEHKVSLREEDPEQTIVRMLSFLRSLKYRPPSGDLKTFRTGLLQGEKDTVHPLLAWCLTRLDELKKRAFVGKFLVPLDIPPDFIQSPQANDAHDQYLQLMEDFKEIHKQVEELRNSGFSTAEIKKDIAHMEDEKVQLTKRIERLKQKSDQIKSAQKTLEAAHLLRLEQDREIDLAQQRVEQRNQLMHAEQRLARETQALQDVRASAIQGGPEALIARLQDEIQLNTYLATDKLPSAISEKKKVLIELQRVANEPAMNSNDIDQLHAQIRELQSDYSKMFEQRMAATNQSDDKLGMIRQQAAIISGKKQSAMDRLREKEEEWNSVEEDLAKKKQENAGKVFVPNDAEFKAYVAKLRTKSTQFKEKKSELAELRNEHLVLSRTEEILTARDAELKAQLTELERKKGVSGFLDAQDKLEQVSATKSELDEAKGKTLEDISAMVEQLNAKIADKKTMLAPMVRDLRSLRTQAQGTQNLYEEKKLGYDATMAGLDSSKSRLEQELRAIKEDVSLKESRFHYLQMMIETMKIQIARVQAEMQSYVSQDKDKKSHRDIYTKKIQEQEVAGKSLRDRQKLIKDTHEPSLRQMDMWRDLSKIMECKLSILRQASKDADPLIEEADRIVF